ncbi:MAG: hypothetical protein MI919_35945 [Holophagales bacterium]|nr:hypothetical protein [Holophagales bacterium]
MNPQIPCPCCKTPIEINLDLLLRGAGAHCTQCGGLLSIAPESVQKVSDSVRALRELEISSSGVG